MVDPQALLLTTAEISVAFAGFASLVGVLLQRRDLDLHVHVVNPLRVMLDYALFALFYCLIPFLPMIAGATDATVWRFSSATVLVGVLFYSFINRKWLRRIRSDGSQSLALGRIMRGLDYVSFALLAANALGVFWEPALLPYYAVVLWFVGGAAIGFVSVVSSIWREPS